MKFETYEITDGKEYKEALRKFSGTLAARQFAEESKNLKAVGGRIARERWAGTTRASMGGRPAVLN